jgi:hypothetical protein
MPRSPRPSKQKPAAAQPLTPEEKAVQKRMAEIIAAGDVYEDLVAVRRTAIAQLRGGRGAG